MRKELHNHGLRVEPIQLGTDYVFGGYSKLKGDEVLQPDGQWIDFRPVVERQYRNNFETNACTAFATLNAIEMLTARLFGIEYNFSDRFVAKGSGTDPAIGNYPKAPADFLRKNWSVFEEEWPFDESVKNVAEFYSDIPKKLKTLAIGRGAEYEFGYEYVPTHHPTSLMTALMYSPVCISVALVPDGNGMYFKPDGWRDSHWTTLIGYKEGEYWLIYDSYPSHFEDDELPQHVKKVRWDTFFEVAMRYEIKKQVKNRSAWDKFISILKEALGL